jgi:hypothetical protein
MRSQIYSELSSAEPLSVEERVDLLKKIWHGWSMSGDAGATTWDVLEAIQAQVTDCLYFGSKRLDYLEMAESLTAKAFGLMAGGNF